MDDNGQAGQGLVDDAFSPPSGLETPVSEVTDEAIAGSEPAPASTAGSASEQSYTDTIQNLLSELWKERLVLLTTCLSCVLASKQDVFIPQYH